MKVIKLNSELHIDDEADTAYLYVNNKQKQVHHTNPLVTDDWTMINVDYDDNWKILWIEFSPASKFF